MSRAQRTFDVLSVCSPFFAQRTFDVSSVCSPFFATSISDYESEIEYEFEFSNRIYLPPIISY